MWRLFLLHRVTVNSKLPHFCGPQCSYYLRHGGNVIARFCPGVCLFVCEQEYTRSFWAVFRIPPNSYGKNPLNFAVDHTMVAKWLPFWISAIIRCILLIFVDIHQMMLLLSALVEVCTLLGVARLFLCHLRSFAGDANWHNESQHSWQQSYSDWQCISCQVQSSQCSAAASHNIG